MPDATLKNLAICTKKWLQRPWNLGGKAGNPAINLWQNEIGQPDLTCQNRLNGYHYWVCKKKTDLSTMVNPQVNSVQ